MKAYNPHVHCCELKITPDLRVGSDKYLKWEKQFPFEKVHIHLMREFIHSFGQVYFTPEQMQQKFDNHGKFPSFKGHFTKGHKTYKVVT